MGEEFLLQVLGPAFGSPEPTSNWIKKHMLVISAPLWKGGRQREETQACELTSFVRTTVDKRLFQTSWMVGINTQGCSLTSTHAS